MEKTVYIDLGDDVLCYFSVFQNEEGDEIIVPDWYMEEFKNSCWFNSYNIEVEV